ncbi:MAG: F0F1 ATP synthase subunit A [Bacteroidota bacterium]|nr:F0F1 ATP synthase subunit A [Bacteroidota bacterium]
MACSLGNFIFKSLVNSFLIIIFLVFSGGISTAKEVEPGKSKTDYILHHVKDSHEWHITTLGHTHVTLPLPIILYSKDRGLEVFSSNRFLDTGTHERVSYSGYYLDDHGKIAAEDESRTYYDFSITKNVSMLFLTIIVLVFVMLSVANRYKKYPNKAPKGLASFFEPIIIFIRDEIAKPNIPQKYEKFLPYLLTLFFFIWFGNILGLMPGAANLTGNIAVTFVLATITFILTNINGNKEYWKHIFATPGVPKLLLLILVPVEFIGLFTKPFSLMVRLFVAITAGHIVILSIIGLAFIFNSYVIGFASSILVIFVNIIEILVATIQAYVFTLFSAMYIGAASTEHAHEDHKTDKALIH